MQSSKLKPFVGLPDMQLSLLVMPLSKPTDPHLMPIEPTRCTADTTAPFRQVRLMFWLLFTHNLKSLSPVVASSKLAYRTGYAERQKCSPFLFN